MKTISKTITFLAFLILVLGCKNKDTGSTDSTLNRTIDSIQLNKRIDSLVRDLHYKNSFNGNILVRHKGINIYEKSYGYADSQKKTKLTNEFRFGIGSIYKEFPAVAIMQLSENGKLDLSKTIDTYIPDLPSWSNKITIIHLLQYTSGLVKIDFGKYFSKNAQISNVDIQKDLHQIRALEFEPGSGYIYSNNNPFLLIKIIENISGQTFNAYVQEHLLGPYKLNNTVFKEQYPYDDNTKMALPFGSDFNQDTYKINAQSMLLTSTTEDLSRWLEALHTFRIINNKSIQFLAETAKIKDIEMQAPLGNCVLMNDQIKQHSHHGSMGNYEGLIQRYNAEDLSIVILTNQKNSNVFNIADHVKNVVLKSNNKR